MVLPHWEEESGGTEVIKSEVQCFFVCLFCFVFVCFFQTKSQSPVITTKFRFQHVFFLAKIGVIKHFTG